MTILAPDAPITEPFDLFMRFLGEKSITAIAAATNGKTAASMHRIQRNARNWSPLTSGELLCWLGLLFYMVSYIECPQT